MRMARPSTGALERNCFAVGNCCRPKSTRVLDMGRRPTDSDCRTEHMRCNDLQYPTILLGEMSEWLKEHAWKACVGETLPWVRI